MRKYQIQGAGLVTPWLSTTYDFLRKSLNINDLGRPGAPKSLIFNDLGKHSGTKEPPHLRRFDVKLYFRIILDFFSWPPPSIFGASDVHDNPFPFLDFGVDLVHPFSRGISLATLEVADSHLNYCFIHFVFLLLVVWANISLQASFIELSILL